MKRIVTMLLFAACCFAALSFVFSNRHLAGQVNTLSQEDNAACANGTAFPAPRTFPLGDTPEDILAGDYNGDKLLDLAVTNAGSTFNSPQLSILPSL